MLLANLAGYISEAPATPQTEHIAVDTLAQLVLDLAHIRGGLSCGEGPEVEEPAAYTTAASSSCAAKPVPTCDPGSGARNVGKRKRRRPVTDNTKVCRWWMGSTTRLWRSMGAWMRNSEGALEVPVMVTLVGIDLRGAQILGPSHETAPGFKPCWDAQEGIGYQFPRLLSFCRRRQSTQEVQCYFLCQCRRHTRRAMAAARVAQRLMDVLAEHPPPKRKVGPLGTSVRATVDELLAQLHAPRIVRSDYELIQAVPELQQLMLWGMMLDEFEDDEDDAAED